MKIKTQEITGWVSQNSIGRKREDSINHSFSEKEFVNSIPARLIIYIPEKKTEITESMVDIMVGDFIGMLDGKHVKSAMEMKDKWKEKLFNA